MKVRVNPSLCEGFGKCAKAAPEIFTLDADGYASTDENAEVPAALIAKVREAEGACPTGAVLIEE